LLIGLVGQPFLAAAGFPAGWTGLLVGDAPVQSRLQAVLPAHNSSRRKENVSVPKRHIV
jgi:hypothetical protein